MISLHYDQKNLINTSDFPFADFPFQTFNTVQSRILDFYASPENCLIAAATSAGKAQPIDQIVITPLGTLPIGMLKKGQEVIGADGLPTEVTGIFPQGKKEVYTIGFSDGTSTRCCGEHLWAVRNRNEKSRAKPFRIVKTLDIKAGKDHIPLVQNPVQFKSFNLEIRPYLLGVLIGDGGIKYASKVTISDSDVLKRMSEELPPGVKCNHIEKYDYLLASELHSFNPLSYELKKMALFGLGSSEKFIPDSYKFASVAARIDILRGLMDSDGGSYSDASPTFEVTSKRLAEDMAFLVRSLGGYTKIRYKPYNKYVYRGEVRQGKPVYRLTVNFNDLNPFWCSRKANLWSKRSCDRLKIVESVESCGEEECVCISVANPYGLYLTDDFIVTHNTVCAELFLSQEVRERGGKGMYLAPLRALSQEKVDDWTEPDHHFKDLKISICTGDYRLTAERKQEIEDANLIIFTSEMLNSRSRNFRSENNKFLREVGTLVIDESHLLTVPGRGDHLEAGLMKFTELNPDCRIILLSATMPNVDEVGGWVSKLTSRNTNIVMSKYRPCPLEIHYPRYYSQESYGDSEKAKIEMALEIFQKHRTDKFLFFVHSKRTGDMLKEELSDMGIQCEFHNADLVKEKRRDIEKRFKEDSSFRAVVATSTLAWGCNLPARRVVVLGVHRGMNLVPNYDISQMVGRAGRPRYDPMGDAYVLLPHAGYSDHKARLQKPERIESQMNGKTLAFHLVSEIHHRDIQSTVDVHDWYERTLANYQKQSLGEDVLNEVLGRLQKCSAIREEEACYETTPIGAVSSLFYYSPYDVSDWCRNFTALFERSKEDNDYWIAMALGNTDSQRGGIVTSQEREDVEVFKYLVRKNKLTTEYRDGALKAGCCYWHLLNGGTPACLSGITRGLQGDFERLVEILGMLDSMAGKWGKKDFFKRLKMRIQYGVPEELVDLCTLKGIGGAKARKLWDVNVREPADVLKYPERVKAALKCSQKVLTEIVESAKNQQ